MRHRLRERPKPASSNPRRRGRRPRAAPAEEEVSLQAAITSDWSAPCEGTLISELDELLTVDEAGGWWKEDEGPVDTTLTDLLQHLVGCEDNDVPAEARPSYNESAPIMAASHITAGSLIALHPTNTMAASHPTNKMAAPPVTAHNRPATYPTNKTTVPRISADKTAARSRCPGNKNALAARLNRLRKKEYVSGLEGRVARLSGENQRLERERRLLGARVRELEEESRYLRAVLANDSSLSQLLGRLTGLGGVKLSTSLFRSPRKPDDHDYALPWLVKTEEEEEGAHSGGVCLHVDKEKVSVEFCPACARNASSAAKLFFFR
ncbi:CREB/ATF bZIP transcription factor [Mixophyes fleayi]|uniref:CREB/ATF bZIP transcription factor n=1 Tax=Mixophyes fleayi TaxID=3061075 RepID=UPI003F4DCF23